MKRRAASRARALFADSYGGTPVVIASAPGRLNLIGEHTDYNGGPVLPVALERRTAVAVGVAARWELVSEVDHRRHVVELPSELRGEWTDYVVGVIRELEAIGASPAGAQLTVASDVPIGAGLSSSAAICVAVAKVLSALGGRRVSNAALVDVASRAEHEHVGVRGGRMDQTVAVYAKRGTALLYETASERMRPVTMTGRVWLVETGVAHRLTGGALNTRRRECEAALAVLRQRWPGLRCLSALDPAQLGDAERQLDPTAARRVRHVVSETARVYQAVAALERTDLPGLGRLLLEGHASLRDNYESTCAEADLIVESAARHGAYGARLTGAGWGGAVVMLAAPESERRVLAGIERDFQSAFGRAPAAWSTEAGGGAGRDPIRP